MITASAKGTNKGNKMHYSRISGRREARRHKTQRALSKKLGA